jgi:NAD(P)H dehydrogenase (quinone)
MEVIAMILITGAAGKTGRAVLKALLSHNRQVRVLVRRSEQAEEMTAIGAADAVIGDMEDADSYRRAMAGVTKIYHICPNMHPAEIEIGSLAINAARENKLDHFVYHSVLHPQVEKMPHHWNKMRVEEMLFESKLDFTILQPAPYMQNILAGKNQITSEGIYSVPYPANARFSLVDLEDLGEAAALVLSGSDHNNAIYEIVGTEPLSQDEVALIIGRALNRTVSAEEIGLDSWEKKAKKSGMDDYQRNTLLKMFRYYRDFGLAGNSNLLRLLIGREPKTLAAFIEREFSIS